ncbi:CUB domain-containing protein 2-like isoform X2 [Pleurodeles waltl]|uniref:CUB domain-containing protein 2-like isoform X3 n=1 Tax=Pleurodeles waltl TaxID=8319 RepID=UPI003709C56C
MHALALMGLLALCATGWALPALNPLLERNHRLKRDLEACGGTLTAKSGEITTPYYPLQYPRSTQCTWIIRATKLVNITFVDFELESGMNCTFDFMKFDDLSEIPVYIPKSKYCGTVAPNTWVSFRSSVQIIFSSDRTVQMRGFKLRYTAE